MGGKSGGSGARAAGTRAASRVILGRAGVEAGDITEARMEDILRFRDGRIEELDAAERRGDRGAYAERAGEGRLRILVFVHEREGAIRSR